MSKAEPNWRAEMNAKLRGHIYRAQRETIFRQLSIQCKSNGMPLLISTPFWIRICALYTPAEATRCWLARCFSFIRVDLANAGVKCARWCCCCFIFPMCVCDFFFFFFALVLALELSSSMIFIIFSVCPESLVCAMWAYFVAEIPFENVFRFLKCSGISSDMIINAAQR